MAIIRTMYKKKEAKESEILLKLKAMDKKRAEKGICGLQAEIEK